MSSHDIAPAENGLMAMPLVESPRPIRPKPAEGVPSASVALPPPLHVQEAAPAEHADTPHPHPSPFPLHPVSSARHILDMIRGATPRPSSPFIHTSGSSENAGTSLAKTPSPGPGKWREDAASGYDVSAWPEDMLGSAPRNEAHEEEAAAGLMARMPSKTDDINKGKVLETIVMNLGVKKKAIPWDKTLFLGLLAGFFVSQGCLFALTAGGGIPAEIRAAYPAIPKLLFGATFPVGIFYIILFGGELFTGNTMILIVALLNKRISFLDLLRNWVLVYVSNLAACLLFGWLFGYVCNLFVSEPYLAYVKAISETKTTLQWHVLFFRGIPANALVCLSIFLGLAARDVTGKIIAMWIPIVTFAVIGFEHCVANMILIPMGIYYGSQATWGGFWYNQSAVVLGNIVGGAFLIGGSEYFMYHWHSASEPEVHHGKWGRGNGQAGGEDLAAIATVQVDGDGDAGDGLPGVQRLVKVSPKRASFVEDVVLTPLHNSTADGKVVALSSPPAKLFTTAEDGESGGPAGAPSGRPAARTPAGAQELRLRKTSAPTETRVVVDARAPVVVPVEVIAPRAHMRLMSTHVVQSSEQ